MGGAPVSVTGGGSSSTPSGAWCGESSDVHELRTSYPDACEVRCRGTNNGFDCGTASGIIERVSPGLFAISTAHNDIVFLRAHVAEGETITVRSSPRWIARASQTAVTANEIRYSPFDGSEASVVAYPDAGDRQWIIAPQMLWVENAGAICGRDVFRVEPGGAYYLDLARAQTTEVELCFGS